MDKHHVECTFRHPVAKLVQRGTGEHRSRVSLVDKVAIRRHFKAMPAGFLHQLGDLARHGFLRLLQLCRSAGVQRDPHSRRKPGNSGCFCGSVTLTGILLRRAALRRRFSNTLINIASAWRLGTDFFYINRCFHIVTPFDRRDNLPVDSAKNRFYRDHIPITINGATLRKDQYVICVQ
jgi:hypothetical protein